MLAPWLVATGLITVVGVGIIVYEIVTNEQLREDLFGKEEEVHKYRAHRERFHARRRSSDSSRGNADGEKQPSDKGENKDPDSDSDQDRNVSDNQHDQAQHSQDFNFRRRRVKYPTEEEVLVSDSRTVNSDELREKIDQLEEQNRELLKRLETIHEDGPVGKQDTAKTAKLIDVGTDMVEVAHTSITNDVGNSPSMITQPQSDQETSPEVPKIQTNITREQEMQNSEDSDMSWDEVMGDEDFEAEEPTA